MNQVTSGRRGYQPSHIISLSFTPASIFYSRGERRGRVATLLRTNLWTGQLPRQPPLSSKPTGRATAAQGGDHTISTRLTPLNTMYRKWPQGATFYCPHISTQATNCRAALSRSQTAYCRMGVAAPRDGSGVAGLLGWPGCAVRLSGRRPRLLQAAV